MPDQCEHTSGDSVGKNESPNINTENKLVNQVQPPNIEIKEVIFRDLKFVEHVPRRLIIYIVL